MAQSPVCKNLNAIWHAMGPLVMDDDLIDFWSDHTSDAGKKMDRVLSVLEGLMDKNGCEYPASRALDALARMRSHHPIRVGDD